MVPPQHNPIPAQTYSQDVRVQMGEQVHTELHQPLHRAFDVHEYQQLIKANNHFIAENLRNYQKEAHQLPGNYAVNRSQVTSDNSINHNLAEMYPAQEQQKSNTSMRVQAASENSIDHGFTGTNLIQREVVSKQS